MVPTSRVYVLPSNPAPLAIALARAIAKASPPLDFKLRMVHVSTIASWLITASAVPGESYLTNRFPFQTLTTTTAIISPEIYN